MIESTPNHVFAAFEILLEEIEVEIDFINKVEAEAFERSDYDGTRETLESAGQIKAFREKIMALRDKWETFAGTQTQRANTEEETIRIEQGLLGRLPGGLSRRLSVSLRLRKRDCFQSPIGTRTAS